MKDLQSEVYDGVPIQKVGVKRVVRPIMIMDPISGFQWVTAEFDMYVRLPGDRRGTHMSRFIELVEDTITQEVINIDKLSCIKDDMVRRLDSDQGHITCRFPYFYSVGGSKMFCRVTFHVSDTHRPVMEVVTLGTSCCPCSKEISERGAHNQRSEVLIRIQSNELVLIEDVVAVANASMSCPMYPLLKRVDEKRVTEQAYDNPKFVEDTLREVAGLLMADKRITWFHIKVTNEESIHPHDAYAEEECGKIV